MEREDIQKNVKQVKTGVMIVAVLAVVLLILSIFFAMGWYTTAKGYKQTTTELSVAQDSITVLSNQLASKNSDIRGLRTANLEFQNQLAATKRLYEQTRLRLRNILSKYESALTQVENLMQLRDIYYGYKLELEVSEAKFAERMQKYKKRMDQLQEENTRLRLTIATPVQKK